MSDASTAAETTAETTEQTASTSQQQAEEVKTDAKFTQADVDRILRERLAQQRKNEFGDYAEIKAKAEGAKTLEERMASLENELTVARTDALRARIAAEFGISTKKGDRGEPSDADLFLTGTDESTLTAQAERLGVRAAAKKQQGNVAPKEGDTKTSGKDDSIPREFVRELFGQAD